MFEQTFVDTQNRAFRPWTLAASATLQTGTLVLLLIIPLLHPEGPLMRLDAPPVIYRPTTMIQPLPANQVTTAKRPTLLLFSDSLRAPTHIPREIAQLSDAPEFTSDTTPGPVPGTLALDPFIGSIPRGFATPTASDRTATPPVTVVPPVPLVPLRVSTSVQAALLIFGPKPVYPPLARAARVQGTVRLQAIIGTDGNIRNLRVMSGPPLLVKAALDAVQRWRYRATVLNGTPVEVSTEVEVNFTLTQ